ncbi:helix-turn-helix transcriptional regulator [Leptolyngbya sp. AN03gr2]|uniref:helix-turn-helix transcriptional regulator n=1 Tax=unclassified Leptolyngbya TaxID=2650499 RepID=UPI003D3225D2
MAITISRADYDELWKVCNPAPLVTSHPDYCERVEIVPEQFGEGYVRSIRFRGINLMLFNYQLHHDLHLIDEVSETMWEIGFNLSGNRNNKCTGESFLEWGAYEGKGTWTTYANDPVLKVDIELEAPNELNRLVSDTLEELPVEIRQCIEDCDRKRFDEFNVITPAMRSTLEKILNCSFQGKTRQLYLEGQCLELIALKLEQLKDPDQYRQKSFYSMNLDDIDRIHLAKKIMTENADNPPSLLELARQVGLNDFKLKGGFRQVFGTTVFGYLHQHRMETARQLLAERRMNVKEVAQAVGYASQSRFAEAFRKQFGMNPKSYLLGKKSV